ncbi:MAG: ABC transporter ATP-binding protein [Flavobacteriales bacterium]|nr:ABC transporter ATP-binding protein [Flavobacteriales bacterium]
MSHPLLSVSDLHFAHTGGKAVLSGVSFTMPVNEVLVVVGASGSGKTTLLRCIAGLDLAQRGRVVLDGALLQDEAEFMAPEERPVGMVFQGHALFPHLTVNGNIGFGLYRVPKAERIKRVADEVASVGLNGLGDRYPHQLSGGQQQRVAIARSLVLRPRLLLMDEPFSDLDRRTRQQVRTEVLQILRAHGTGAIVVTHDREDAYHLADRIAELDQGRFVRIAPAEDLRKEWAQHPLQG